jgi:hypothetical protein
LGEIVVDMDFSALSSLGYFPDAEALGDSQSEAKIEDASEQQAKFFFYRKFEIRGIKNKYEFLRLCLHVLFCNYIVANFAI